MGHRANFVLIRDGKAKAYYDHWGALACTLSLEEGAKKLEKSVPKLYERVDELMDWGFAEAGFLIDYDERVCIAFGMPDVDMDDMPEEYQEQVQRPIDALHEGWESFVRYIEKGWLGYSMIWDSRGVDAFAAHLERRKITAVKTAEPSAPKEYATARPEVVIVAEVLTKKAPAKKASAAKPAKMKKSG